MNWPAPQDQKYPSDEAIRNVAKWCVLGFMIWLTITLIVFFSTLIWRAL